LVPANAFTQATGGRQEARGGALEKPLSRQDDVIIANPFGPPAKGWRKAAETMERAATSYRINAKRFFAAYVPDEAGWSGTFSKSMNFQGLPNVLGANR